jgi:biopolymer transport protein ExbD
MPNRAAKYDVVAGVMASAQRLGLQKIGLANIPDFAPQAKAP